MLLHSCFELLTLEYKCWMFQEIDSKGLAVIASCLLDIGPKQDRKMIIKANSKSSFSLHLPILAQGSLSNKLEFIFLQTAPQLGHQSANVTV